MRTVNDMLSTSNGPNKKSTDYYNDDNEDNFNIVGHNGHDRAFNGGVIVEGGAWFN